jgi:hypothetical protein
MAKRVVAKQAYYDVYNNYVMVALSNGAIFAFPPILVSEFADKTQMDLAEVELANRGKDLLWDRIAVCLTVSEVLKGKFVNKYAQPPLS